MDHTWLLLSPDGGPLQFQLVSWDSHISDLLVPWGWTYVQMEQSAAALLFNTQVQLIEIVGSSMQCSQKLSITIVVEMEHCILGHVSTGRIVCTERKVAMVAV